MIWNSPFLMGAIDCLIIGLASYLLFALWRHHAQMRRLGLVRGLVLIVAGLCVFAGFYLFDLATMLVLPSVIGSVRAMAVMQDLHLEYSWVDTMIGLGLISLGMSMLLHRLLPQLGSAIDKAEAAQAALRESETRYRAIAGLAPVGIFHTDADGDVTFVNETWCQLSGMPRRAAMGKGWIEGIHADDREKIAADWSRATSNGIKLFENEYRFTNSDGVVIWCFLRALPELGRAGQVVGYVGALTDITDRKHAEQSIAESATMFEKWKESNVIGIMQSNAESGEIIEANKTLLNLLGYSRQELLEGKLNWTEITPPEYLHLNTTALAEAEEKGFFTPFEKEYFHKDGTRVPILIGGARFRKDPDIYIDFIVDLTEKKLAEQALSYQATHDALTGLINRSDFERRVERVLETTRTSHVEHALCYLDLDQFKVINDTCGHAAGDELLRQLGQLLPMFVRKRDTLARLGGDEFGVLMEHCSLGQARRAADSMRGAIADFRFVWQEQTFRIGVSIGLVPITDMSESVANILSAADGACYAAKDKGRNRVHVYHPGDTDLARRHGEMQWVARINHALEENSFELWSQSIVPVKSGAGRGEHFEILLRLIDERGEPAPPGAFLPAAERYGLSTRLDRWVVGATLDWLSRNPQRLDQLHLCCINLSGTSVADEEFLKFVQERLEQSQVPGRKICFEVTETAAIANLSRAMNFMRILKQRGCQFALDDFGSGLSSFAYLKTLPVDYLKIDGAFVKDITDDKVDLALVRSINDIGKVMGIGTIAEFVESDAILEKLREIGVDYAQGYSIGRPAPIVQAWETIKS